MDTRVHPLHARPSSARVSITGLLSHWRQCATLAVRLPCQEQQHVNRKTRLTQRRHRVPASLLPG
jgi:hypothetical protein